MVSSTVYGIEELLEQVYALLNGFGYEVWCSHKGTVQVYPNQTALESCLTAVEKTDLFLCIKTFDFLNRFGAGVSERQARRDLKELEEFGFLERVGAGPTTAYERTDKPR